MPFEEHPIVLIFDQSARTDLDQGRSKRVPHPGIWDSGSHDNLIVRSVVENLSLKVEPMDAPFRCQSLNGLVAAHVIESVSPMFNIVGGEGRWFNDITFGIVNDLPDHRKILFGVKFLIGRLFLNRATIPLHPMSGKSSVPQLRS